MEEVKENTTSNNNNNSNNNSNSKVISKKSTNLKSSQEALDVKITEQAEKLRKMREVAKSEGRAWRDDSEIMNAVFELMRLKHGHKKYKAETLPERVDEVLFKVRWKVIGPDGVPVVLQLPFKCPLITGQQMKDAVIAFTKKKYPKLSDFSTIYVVMKVPVEEKKSAEKSVVKQKPGVPLTETMSRELRMDEEFRLNILFPGPKFEAVKVIFLDCVNEEMKTWTKGKQERLEKHLAKQAEDKANKEKKKKEAAEAKKNAPAKKGNNNNKNKKNVGRGKGRGGKK